MLQTRRKGIYLYVLFVIIADSSGFKVKGVTQTVCHQAIEISRARISPDPQSPSPKLETTRSVSQRCVICLLWCAMIRENTENLRENRESMDDIRVHLAAFTRR